MISCSLLLGTGTRGQSVNGLGLDPSQEMIQYTLEIWQRKEGLPQNSIHAILQTRDGYLWLGTQEGLARFDGVKFTVFNKRNTPQLKHNHINVLFESTSGTLWIGTNGGGLNRLINGKFRTYLAGEGVTQNFMWSLYRDRQNHLWAGNDAGELLRYQDGQFAVIVPSLGNRIMAICEDRTGALWLGTVNGLGRLAAGKLTFYPKVDGTSNHVLCIYEDKKGHLWIGTRVGLHRFHDGEFKHYPMNEGSSHTIIRAVHEDREGSLWACTFGGGLRRMREGTITAFTKRDGLSSNVVGPIYEDQEGTLWIGSIGGGLNRLKDGKFTSYTSAEGLYDDNVYAILEDEQGHLWMSCNNGVFCVRKQDLNDFAVGKIAAVTCKAFSEADGMKSSECNGGQQTAGAKTSDGKIWFPTTMGVVMVDPAAQQVNTVVPPAMIEQVLIDRQPVQRAGQTKIPPGHGELEFHYTALTFVSPQKVRFKYKLEPFDEAWLEAGTRRAAYYTNIPPGDYRFRVMACNNDGIWNETEASFAFTLAPHFYQTAWFYLLSVLAVALLALRGHLMYRRYQERKLRAAQLERQLAEAQLQVLKMQLQPLFYGDYQVILKDGNKLTLSRKYSSQITRHFHLPL
ncbi:MAG: ligand-binding sensor domain-containing protein [bacterium]